MDTIITIADPGYQSGPLLFGLSLLVVGLIAMVVGAVADGGGKRWGGLLAGVGLVATICGGIGAPLMPWTAYEVAVREAKVASLEEAGFTDVELSGDKFTASDDGAYFKGALVEVGDLTWQVVEVAR